ncbi:MAG: hypothetical protein LQ339_007135 [Xanthoria mediterranea]|nr:MAG: hypothetical protein LQ339_007135 [Xanthoria mediterranea]
MPVPRFEWITIEFSTIQPLSDPDQLKDMGTALSGIRRVICANRQPQKVEAGHTATSVKATCPDVRDANQNSVLHWAIQAMQLGQAKNGPAALTGRVITSGHPNEVWTEFTTSVYLPVPKQITPGWGTNTWCYFNVRAPGLPVMQLRMLTRGPITDKWYSEFNRNLLIIIARRLEDRPHQETTPAMSLDVTQDPQGFRFRLGAYHPGSMEFTVKQELLVLVLLIDQLKTYEARDMTISVLSGGVPVAVGYLYIPPLLMGENGGNVTGVGASNSTLMIDGKAEPLLMLPHWEATIERELSRLSVGTEAPRCGSQK